jgi:hypothetical protein
MQHKPTVQAAEALKRAIDRIVELDGLLNAGKGDAALRAEIIVAHNNRRTYEDAFAASLCDDEVEPDMEDAETCMMVRARQNEAANEPPHVPDALERAIYRRAGAML